MSLSEQARKICGAYFPTPNSVLRSHAPHAALAKMRDGLDELVAAGIVTERPFNQHGSIEFRGSAAASELHREQLIETTQAIFSR